MTLLRYLCLLLFTLAITRSEVIVEEEPTVEETNVPNNLQVNNSPVVDEKLVEEPVNAKTENSPVVEDKPSVPVGETENLVVAKEKQADSENQNAEIAEESEKSETPANGVKSSPVSSEIKGEKSTAPTNSNGSKSPPPPVSSGIKGDKSTAPTNPTGSKAPPPPASSGLKGDKSTANESSKGSKSPSGWSSNRPPPSGWGSNSPPNSGWSSNPPPNSGWESNPPPNSGWGSNSGPNSGWGPNSGSNSGWGSNSGPNSGWGSNSGPNSGWGSNSGPNSGWGSNSGPNSGWGSNSGPNSGWGSNSGPNSGWGSNSGPNNGWGSNSGPNSGWGSNSGPNNGWGSNPPSDSGWSSSNSGWDSNSGWSAKTCASYPECTTPDNSCCECNQNFAKCCSDYFTSSNEGYCQYDKCRPCKTSGSYCVSSNQCCNSQNPDSQNVTTCMNNVCCVSPSSAGCHTDSDCCQPLDAISGYQCDNKYCKPCKKNQQSCTSDAECCGENECGYTLDNDSKYAQFGICCISLNSPCRFSVDVCCDSFECTTRKRTTTPKGTGTYCEPGDNINPGTGSGWGWRNSLTEDPEKRGWSSGGWGNQNQTSGWGNGWNSGNNGWGNVEKVPQQYIWGTCKECKDKDDTCTADYQCCYGLLCENKKCAKISDSHPQCEQPVGR